MVYQFDKSISFYGGSVVKQTNEKATDLEMCVFAGFIQVHLRHIYFCGLLQVITDGSQQGNLQLVEFKTVRVRPQDLRRGPAKL